MTKKALIFLLILVSFLSYSSRIDSLLPKLVIKNYTQNFSFNTHSIVFKSTKNLKLTELLNLIEQNKINPTDNKPTKGINKNFYYWIFFKIQTNEDVTIRNATTNIDKAYLFNLKTPTDTLVKLGTSLKYSEKSIQTEQIIFPISKNTKEQIYVIKIIKLYDSLSFPLTLHSTNEYVRMIAVKNSLYVLFFTIMIILNIGSLIFGLILKQKLFLYYSFYSLTVITIYGTFKNIFSEHLFPEIPEITYYLKNISMLLAVSFNLFALKFLNISNNSKKIAFVFKLTTAISLVLLLISITAPYTYRFYIFTTFYIIFAIYLVFLLVALIILYRKKVKNIIAFSIAFLPVVIGILTTILISFKVLPSYLLSYDLPVFGTVIEFTVFIIIILIETKKLEAQRNKLIVNTSDTKRQILTAFATGSDDAGTFTSIELHDNIGSKLALLKHKLTKNIDISAIDDVEKIKTDISNISTNIEKKIIDKISFKEALITFTEDFKKYSDIEVKITNEDFTDITGDNALQILRVVQETFTNVLKYSKTNRIDVILKNNTIIVKDKGIGFDIEEVSKNATNGLNNMKIRIDNIGGELLIKSVKGKGTEIKIKINKTNE